MYTHNQFCYEQKHCAIGWLQTHSVVRLFVFFFTSSLFQSIAINAYKYIRTDWIGIRVVCHCYKFSCGILNSFHGGYHHCTRSPVVLTTFVRRAIVVPLICPPDLFTLSLSPSRFVCVYVFLFAFALYFRDMESLWWFICKCVSSIFILCSWCLILCVLLPAFVCSFVCFMLATIDCCTYHRRQCYCTQRLSIGFLSLTTHTHTVRGSSCVL